MTTRRQSYRQGQRAEFRCELYLRLKFYRILARRYRCPVGEIDIIARRGNTLVFIEVKGRTELDSAAYAIRPRQQARIIRAAEYFIAANPNTALLQPRFDAMLVRIGRPTIRHLINAWQVALK